MLLRAELACPFRVNVTVTNNVSIIQMSTGPVSVSVLTVVMSVLHVQQVSTDTVGITIC